MISTMNISIRTMGIAIVVIVPLICISIIMFIHGVISVVICSPLRWSLVLLFTIMMTTVFVIMISIGMIMIVMSMAVVIFYYGSYSDSEYSGYDYD